MSQRRKPGEVVRRTKGSGFVGSDVPEFIQVPERPTYDDEGDPCLLGCGDENCREWANLKVVGGEFDGQCLFHISECQMEDAPQDSKSQ